MSLLLNIAGKRVYLGSGGARNYPLPVYAGNIPVRTTPASVTPTLGGPDTTFTYTEGEYTGDTPITVTFTLTLDGVDVSGDMVGQSYTPTVEGTLVYTEVATNAAGSSTSQSITINVADIAPATTTMMTSVDITGRVQTSTLEFFEDQAATTPKAVPVFQSQGGRIGIHTAEDFWFRWAPYSADVTIGGGVTAIGYGVEVNPNHVGSDATGLFEHANSNPGDPTRAVPYDPSLNIFDPNLNPSGTYQVTAGSVSTFVKAMMDTSGFLASPVNDYHYFTVLDTVPDADFVMPWKFGSTLSPILYMRDLDTSVLRDLTPVSGGYTVSEALAEKPYCIIETAGGWDNGEVRNTICVEAGGDAYSAFYGLRRTKTHYALQSNYPIEDRMVLIQEVAHHALQVYGALVNWGNTGGAGQAWDRVHDAAFAAFLFQNTQLLDAVLGHSSNDLGSLFNTETIRPRVVQPRHFGAFTNSKTLNWPSSNGQWGTVYLPEMEGTTIWEGDGEGAAPDSRYSGFATALCEMNLPMYLLRNGPNGLDFDQEVVGLDGYVRTNHRIGPIAHAFRMRARGGPSKGGLSVGTRRDYWDAWSPNLNYAPDLQPPEMLAHDNVEDVFQPSSGGVTWDFTSWSGSETPITQADVRYSLDNVQFVEALDAGRSGELTGLTQQPTWFQYRNQNAVGAAPWTQGFSTSDGPPANFVTPGGPSTNALPVNTVTPKILSRPYAYWPASYYKEVFDLNTRRARAGVGYWTGFPEMSFTYQWEDASENPISGETAADLYLGWDYLPGQQVVGAVTATNTQGSATARTAALTVPNYIGRVEPRPEGYVTPSGTVVNIGAAFADRWVGFLIWRIVGANARPSGVQFAGAPCTRVAVASPGGSTDCWAEVWITNSKVPTGTSGALTYTGLASAFALPFTLNKATSPLTPLDSAVSIEELDPTLQLDTSDGGFMLAFGLLSSSTGGKSLPITPTPTYFVLEGATDGASSTDPYTAVAEHTVAETRSIDFGGGSFNSRIGLAVSWGNG